MKELSYLIKNMSQVEIARKLNVCKATITYWKSIKRVPFKNQAIVSKLYKKVKVKNEKR